MKRKTFFLSIIGLFLLAGCGGKAKDGDGKITKEQYDSLLDISNPFSYLAKKGKETIECKMLEIGKTETETLSYDGNKAKVEYDNQSVFYEYLPSNEDGKKYVEIESNDGGKTYVGSYEDSFIAPGGIAALVLNLVDYEDLTYSEEDKVYEFTGGYSFTFCQAYKGDLKFNNQKLVQVNLACSAVLSGGAGEVTIDISYSGVKVNLPKYEMPTSTPLTLAGNKFKGDGLVEREALQKEYSSNDYNRIYRDYISSFCDENASFKFNSNGTFEFRHDLTKIQGRFTQNGASGSYTEIDVYYFGELDYTISESKQVARGIEILEDKIIVEMAFTISDLFEDRVFHLIFVPDLDY